VTLFSTLDYKLIEKELAGAKDRPALYRTIVDTPFSFKVDMARLHLGIIVLLLADKKTGMIDRVALSNTELAKGTTDISVKKFEDIKIPVSDPDNYIAKAIRTKESQFTTDWQYLFVPALTPEEARFNQAGGGIACSSVCPLSNGIDGAIIYSYFQYPEQLGAAQQEFMQTYTALASRQLSITL
jgi:hypothetical protein